MREGAIQQTGSPLELYTRPANLFVAGFFGSPAMNLIRGKLRSSAGGLVFKETDGGTLEFKLANRAELNPLAGQEVVAGIRPEEVEFVGDAGKPSGTRFQGVVELIEPRGADTFFHIQTGAHTVVSRSALKIDRNDAGRRAQFELNLAALHFFDPSTGLRIKPEGGDTK
jgi:multiple sugar transport system ATP-binding protein